MQVLHAVGAYPWTAGPTTSLERTTSSRAGPPIRCPPQRSAMAIFKVKLRGIEKTPFDLPTDEPHRIVASRAAAFRLEVADVHFNFDSAVFLPDAGAAQPSSGAEDPAITGLAVLRACLLYAQANPEQPIVIAGHTDTVGTPGYNLTLSNLRAANVRAALLGNRDDWVTTAMGKNCVADQQRILRFVAFTLGWDCNPGDVDNQAGPQTAAAVRSFQDRYNTEFEATIGVDGKAGPETWGAFFDVTMFELADLLEKDASGLAAMQQGIVFVDPNHAAVGCGENHPIEAVGVDQFRSATNRRVEILFFDPGDVPTFPCHPSSSTCIPASCPIYRLKHFDFEPLPVEELDSLQQLVVAWPDDFTADLPDDLTLVLEQQGSAPVELPWTAGSVEDGLRSFTFTPFVPAVACTLKARTGGSEVVLWNEQSVDDPSNPPAWDHTIAELIADVPSDDPVVAQGDLPPEESDHGGELPA